MDIKLGFDLNCFTNRLPEPERWTDFVASCGVKVVQFNFDLIDFMLPRTIQEHLVVKTLACCKAKGIRIKAAYGGHNHHQNYLGYPDDEVASAYEDYYMRMTDLTAVLGGEGFGTMFAVLTTATQNDANQRERIITRTIESYFRLAHYAKGKKLKYLLYEIASVPREVGATFVENDSLLQRMESAEIPMRMCLDVGHRNQEFPGTDQADPYAWIRRYGKVAPIIHIQQTTGSASNHWPFTPEYNAMGDIFPAKILQAIADSGAQQEILLALEVRHKAYYPDEYQVEKNLAASVQYWRQWVKE
jgi:D-erythrulose 1-phosphate 3-epimerase